VKKLETVGYECECGKLDAEYGECAACGMLLKEATLVRRADVAARDKETAVLLREAANNLHAVRSELVFRLYRHADAIERGGDE